MMHKNHFALFALFTMTLAPANAHADEFTYIDDAGKTVKVEARLAGSGKDLHALELADGKILLVPQAAVTRREPGPGPEPAGVDEVAGTLTKKFGEDYFRVLEQDPFLVGLVLSAPLPKSSERRVQLFLKKAVRFMKNVDENFTRFTKRMDLPAEELRYPLVMLVFEADSDFDNYTQLATGGDGLSAGNISGFYSLLTNYLVLRMSECNSFAVPLHEAIHQQVYNRRMLRRLAPIPVWFNEGIATGFEGTGERINVLPLNISTHYARRAMSFSRINWSEVVENDRAFDGDVLAGDAYAHAWSLHWLLVSRYKDEYAEYVKLLSQKEPLREEENDQRVQELEQVFGKSVPELQKSFRSYLESGIKRQKVPLRDPTPVGLSVSHSGLAEVAVSAVQQGVGGSLLVKGTARNISPIRDMSFHITVETTSGMYADWYLPDLKMKKRVPLRQQVVLKRMVDAPGGPSNTFRVRVRAVAPESDEGKKWSRGQLPVPVYRRR